MGADERQRRLDAEPGLRRRLEEADARAAALRQRRARQAKELRKVCAVGKAAKAWREEAVARPWSAALRADAEASEAEAYAMMIAYRRVWGAY